MEQNVGAFDQKLRTATGAIAGVASLAILAGALSLPAALSPVLGVVALVMLVTGVVGMCPIYSLFGVDTCPRKSSPSR
jgi:hypothetical protein